MDYFQELDLPRMTRARRSVVPVTCTDTCSVTTVVVGGVVSGKKFGGFISLLSISGQHSKPNCGIVL